MKTKHIPIIAGIFLAFLLWTLAAWAYGARYASRKDVAYYRQLFDTVQRPALEAQCKQQLIEMSEVLHPPMKKDHIIIGEPVTTMKGTCLTLYDLSKRIGDPMTIEQVLTCQKYLPTAYVEQRLR